MAPTRRPPSFDRTTHHDHSGGPLQLYAEQMHRRRWASREVLEELRERLRDSVERSPALQRELARKLEAGAERDQLAQWLGALDKLEMGEGDPVGDRLLSRLRGTPLKLDAGSTRRELRARMTHLLGANTATAGSLLQAGLTVLLVRYNPALEHYYYHHILSELTPSAVATEIAITVRIQRWQGTSGWAAEYARLRGRAWPDYRDHPDAIALYSAAADIRGRNTLNRHILGSRSWLGLPFFDERYESPAGLVVVTFPLDGMFWSPVMRTSPWAVVFQEIVGALRSELLRALRADDRTNVLPMGRGPSDRVWDRALVGEQARALLPDFPTPDDALGLLAVIQGRTRHGVSDIHVQLRRKSVVDPFFELMDLATSFPEDVEVGVASNLLDVRSAGRCFWQQQDGKTSDLDPFYPPDAAPNTGRSPRSVRTAHRGPPRSDGPDAAAELASALRDAIERATGPLEQGSVVDLVVPLVTARGVTEGWLRINCARDRNFEYFHELFTVFDEQAGEVRRGLADLIADLGGRIGANPKLLVEPKVLASIRASLCETVAWRLARAFYPDGHREPDLRRVELFLATTPCLGWNPDGLEPFFDDLIALVDELAEMRTRLPRVLMVSFWLNADRPVVTKVTESPHDKGATVQLASLLRRDRGLLRVLYEIATYSGEYYWGGIADTYRHIRDGEAFAVLPPSYVPDRDPPVPIEFTVTRHKQKQKQREKVVTTLKAGEWTASLTWAHRRYPRPASYLVVPRGITDNVFGDVRAMPLRLEQEDAVGTGPAELSSERTYHDTVLSRAEDLLRPISNERGMLWILRRMTDKAWIVAIRATTPDPSRLFEALESVRQAWTNDQNLLRRDVQRFFRHGLASLRTNDIAKALQGNEEARSAFQRMRVLAEIETDRVPQNLPTEVGALIREIVGWHGVGEIEASGQMRIEDTTTGDLVLLVDNLLTNACFQGKPSVRVAVETSAFDGGTSERVAKLGVRNHGEMKEEFAAYLIGIIDVHPSLRPNTNDPAKGLEVVRNIARRRRWSLVVDASSGSTTIEVHIREAIS